MKPDELWFNLKLIEVEHDEVVEVIEFVHDKLFSTYQEWKELQKEKFSNFISLAIKKRTNARLIAFVRFRLL